MRLTCLSETGKPLWWWLKSVKYVSTIAAFNGISPIENLLNGKPPRDILTPSTAVRMALERVLRKKKVFYVEYIRIAELLSERYSGAPKNVLRVFELGNGLGRYCNGEWEFHAKPEVSPIIQTKEAEKKSIPFCDVANRKEIYVIGEHCSLASCCLCGVVGRPGKKIKYRYAISGWNRLSWQRKKDVDTKDLLCPKCYRKARKIFLEKEVVSRQEKILKTLNRRVKNEQPAKTCTGRLVQ